MFSSSSVKPRDSCSRELELLPKEAANRSTISLAWVPQASIYTIFYTSLNYRISSRLSNHSKHLGLVDMLGSAHNYNVSESVRRSTFCSGTFH